MPSFMQNADRIVGGEAAPSMIPWQVALMSGSFQFCGGTILDSCTILTAAHCTPSTSHKIRAGSINKQTVVQVIPYPDRSQFDLTIHYTLISCRRGALHMLSITQTYPIMAGPSTMTGLF